MKLLSFAADGKEYFGAVSGDGIVTLNDKIGQSDLRAALGAGAMEAMRKAAKEQKPDRKLGAIKFLPVIPHPEKILCAGINYRSHAAETGRELPKQPSMFVRFADTLVGHGGEMIRPNVSDNFDFEGELACVIGRPGRHIKPERALDHVAGYTCFVDGSVRDFQKFSVTSGKNFPGTGPLGPDLQARVGVRAVGAGRSGVELGPAARAIARVLGAHPRPAWARQGDRRHRPQAGDPVLVHAHPIRGLRPPTTLADPQEAPPTGDHRRRP